MANEIRGMRAKTVRNSEEKERFSTWFDEGSSNPSLMAVRYSRETAMSTNPSGTEPCAIKPASLVQIWGEGPNPNPAITLTTRCA